jgi:beta-lactamase superfamily II metal-dependent hydrolase
VLSAYVDRSVPNLSSIVVLAESGDKSMLLTGDARGDKVLKGLQLVGRLDPGKTSTMEVDLLKVPHHGSANNLDDDFFERIIAKHYVFSGNGEHGNPERDALEMLLKARGEDADYAIHLTYPIEEIDVARKDDWKKEQDKEKKKKLKNPNKVVRPNWSAAKHSLASLLAKHPKLAAKVEIVAKDEPHVIDLGDPLGF